MELIESKYLDYCKTCRIMWVRPNKVARQKHQPTNFMKNTNNKAIIAAVIVSTIALIGLTKMAASVVPEIAIASAYVAVATLFALAAVDYRVGPKGYSPR